MNNNPSKRSHLDIEEKESSSDNKHGSSIPDEYYTNDDHDENEDDTLPPLATYLSGWKFWCQFATWPLIFLALNAIIVNTLVAFKEYEFQLSRRHIYWEKEFSIEKMYANDQYEMLKYNRMVVALLLFVDAVIIYHATLFLEKKIREFDMIGEVNNNIDSSSSDINSPIQTPNVYAQVSRKLDAVLGRSTTCRVSILVSIMWLLFVSCIAIGIVSAADLLFAVSPKGKTVCTTQYHGYRNSTEDSNRFNVNDDDYTNPNTDHITPYKPVHGLPDELQEWAQTRHSLRYEQKNVIRLSNGVTFFVASNPLDSTTNHTINQLVSVGSDGNIQFYENIIDPMSFTTIYDDNPLNSEGFCCYYTSQSDQYYMHNSVSLLCVTLLDVVEHGIFPNTTIFDISNREYRNKYFDGISIKVFHNELWLLLSTNSAFESKFEIYKILLGTVLELQKVTEVAHKSTIYEDVSGPFLLGPSSVCYLWTRHIDIVVIVLSFATCSIWLMHVKKLSVGIVPAVAAFAVSCTGINHNFGLAICTLSASATIIGLLGCIHIPLSREKLIWALYTIQCWIAVLIFSGSFYRYYDSTAHFMRASAIIVVSSFIGFILNHPVLYIFGWLSGIWAIFCGFFMLFIPYKFHSGLFAIVLGVIVGSGSVTVGYNLIIYRAHLLYYYKRAWYAMNSAMQNANNHRRRPWRTNTTTSIVYSEVQYTSGNE